jgi:hypothetical protein
MVMLAPVLASLIGLAAMASARPAPATHGCEPGFLEQFDVGPAEPGPLRLASVVCYEFGPASSEADPILSPDGRSIVQWPTHQRPMEILALDRPGLVSLHNQVSFRNFAGIAGGQGTTPDSLAWATDSRSLWSVRQRAVSPGGWALSGLIPISIGRDGTIRELPALHHPAGQLDGLLWVGGDGLAVAQFGTLGGYYRPPHNDSVPTIAMVDAARGRVLADFPAASMPGFTARQRAHGMMISGATAAALSDGRIRAVVQFSRWTETPRTAAGREGEPIRHAGSWLVWTQGEAPDVWPAPYPGDHHNPLALSPDGMKLLVVRPLQPDGWQRECRGGPCPGPPPPPPTPRSGPVAELIDVATRRVLWRVPARADRFWNGAKAPAISGDGRYALIELPPNGDRAPIALIDMRTGRIVQRIAPTLAGSYRPTFGFIAGGRRVWVEVGNVILFYEVRRR